METQITGVGEGVGSMIGQALTFISNPQNLPIVIGMVILFGIVMFIMKGTKHVIDSIFFLLIAFFGISYLCQHFGIQVDVAGALGQVIAFGKSILSGANNAAA